MKIRVIGFASAGEALGGSPAEIELEDGSRLSDLERALLEHYPDLGNIWDRLAKAVDGQLAQGDPALDGATEVALLPPVSGGSPAASEPNPEPLPPVLVDEPIDVAAVAARVESPDCGAVLVFLGNVRNHHRGRSVVELVYSSYRSMAESVLRKIAAELEAAADRLRVSIVHRLGSVPVGEPSVIIAVASPHREAAYEASRVALERLKKEAPIWKRETYSDGETVWREEESLVPRGGDLESVQARSTRARSTVEPSALLGAPASFEIRDEGR